jgi:hypothetical protein
LFILGVKLPSGQEKTTILFGKKLMEEILWTREKGRMGKLSTTAD